MISVISGSNIAFVGPTHTTAIVTGNDDECCEASLSDGDAVQMRVQELSRCSSAPFGVSHNQNMRIFSEIGNVA